MAVHLCPSNPCPFCNPAPTITIDHTRTWIWSKPQFATEPELLRLLKAAVAFMESLTPEQLEEHMAQQRRTSVKAEMACRSEDATVSVRP